MAACGDAQRMTSIWTRFANVAHRDGHGLGLGLAVAVQSPFFQAIHACRIGGLLSCAVCPCCLQHSPKRLKCLQRSDTLERNASPSVRAEAFSLNE